ncbi:MAG: transposase [Alphaproteobacteria bacterium]|nr:transposase [Alphaproteobacteria bacterium]
MWVDGVYSGLRSEEAKLCVLVIVGVNELDDKHFLAIKDGIRESKQSWHEVLQKPKGHEAAKIGDGSLRFWFVLDEDFSETRHQRCWVHKTAILNCLPPTS